MWLASAIEPNGSQRADVDSSHWYRPLAPWIQKENHLSHPARCSAFCGKEVLSWRGRPPRGGGTLNDKQTKAVWGKSGERPTLPGFLERLPSPSSQTRPEMAVLCAIGEAAWGSWWLILAQRMKMVFLILYYQPATYPYCASFWSLKIVLVPAFFVERTRSQYSTKKSEYLMTGSCLCLTVLEPWASEVTRGQKNNRPKRTQRTQCLFRCPGGCLEGLRYPFLTSQVSEIHTKNFVGI